MYESILLILAIILAARYFVWRGRYRKINAQLAELSNRLAEVKTDVERLGARRLSVAPTNLATGPVAAATAGVQTPRPTDEVVDVDGPPIAPEDLAPAAVHAAVPAAKAAPAPWTTAEVSGRSTPSVQAAKAAPAATPAPPRKGVLNSIRERIAGAGGGAELEALIGGNWLNKIGVAVLVIGMALLSSYTLSYVGPLGKVAMGVAIGAVLLGGGVWLERRTRYTLFARPLIGGGWALLYFTAYAAHHFEASRIIDDPVLGLAVLVAVAAGMIAHSLSYRSEMVTGVAYALAFVAIGISPLSLYSLVACLLLAASLVALCWRLGWYRLALGGVIATYGTHALWMAGSATGAPVPAEAYWTIQAILVLYWVTFAAADFIKRPESDPDRQLSLAATIANNLAFAGLSVSLLDGAFPDRLYLLGFAIAAISTAMAFALGRFDRAIPYRFYGLFAGAAATVAAPLAIAELSIAGEWLAIAWAAIAAAMFTAGLWRREMMFRAEAYLVGALGVSTALLLNLFGAVEVSFSLADDRTLRVATIIGLAVALLVGEWIAARFRDRLDASEHLAGALAGHAAILLLAALVFRDVDQSYVGIVWVAGGALLFELGLRLPEGLWRYRGYALLAAGLLALLAVNSNLLLPAAGFPLAWHVAILVAAAALYLGVLWRLRANEGRLPEMETRRGYLAGSAGALLLALAAWNALPEISIAVAWALLALAFWEAGTRLRERSLRIDAWILSAMAWGHLFIVDLVAAGSVGPIATRVISVVAVAALLYYLRQQREDAPQTWDARVVPLLCSFAATAALFALARFEFGRADAVVVWAAMAVVLLGVGVRTKGWDYRLQAYAIGLAIFARSWATNFHLDGDFYGVPERIATTIPVIAALFAIGLLWPRERAAIAGSEGAGPQLVRMVEAWAAPAACTLAVGLIALLTYFEVSGNLLTIAWAVEGLAISAAGFALRVRSLRLLGLALLGVCLVKVVAIDLAGADPIFRILSFIVLGAILVGISFAYTRYREALKSYL